MVARLKLRRPDRDSFAAHKNNAATRGIPFLLSYAEWLQIWQESGHINDRGHSHGKYCMTRFRDSGPYVWWNVKIKLHADNISEAHKGKKISPAHRAKLSAAGKGRVRGPHSAEHRAKIGAAHLGKKHSVESRAKMSAANKGQVHRPHSAETRAKIGAAKKGKPKSSEHRAKISAAVKASVLRKSLTHVAKSLI